MNNKITKNIYKIQKYTCNTYACFALTTIHNMGAHLGSQN